METRRRSITKALSWRITATLVTTAVAFAITGEVKKALSVGLIDTSFKFLLYYFHERIWLKINYGRLEGPDYEL